MPKMHHKRRDEIEAELEQLNKDYSELEHKLGCILDRVTGGCISKPHASASAINEAINRQVQKEWKYAIEDYKENQDEEEEMHLKCRTCENCKFLETNGRGYFQCAKLPCVDWSIEFEPDFGCNRFKDKNAE